MVCRESKLLEDRGKDLSSTIIPVLDSEIMTLPRRWSLGNEFPFPYMRSASTDTLTTWRSNQSRRSISSFSVSDTVPSSTSIVHFDWESLDWRAGHASKDEVNNSVRRSSLSSDRPSVERPRTSSSCYQSNETVDQAATDVLIQSAPFAEKVKYDITRTNKSVAKLIPPVIPPRHHWHIVPSRHLHQSSSFDDALKQAVHSVTPVKEANEGGSQTRQVKSSPRKIEHLVSDDGLLEAEPVARETKRLGWIGPPHSFCFGLESAVDGETRSLIPQPLEIRSKQDGMMFTSNDFNPGLEYPIDSEALVHPALRSEPYLASYAYLKDAGHLKTTAQDSHLFPGIQSTDASHQLSSASSTTQSNIRSSHHIDRPNGEIPFDPLQERLNLVAIAKAATARRLNRLHSASATPTPSSEPPPISPVDLDPDTHRLSSLNKRLGLGLKSATDSGTTIAEPDWLPTVKEGFVMIKLEEVEKGKPLFHKRCLGIGGNVSGANELITKNSNREVAIRVLNKNGEDGVKKIRHSVLAQLTAPLKSAFRKFQSHGPKKDIEQAQYKS